MIYKITLLLLLISQLISSQEYNFDIHNTGLKDYLKLEENIGSKKIPTTSNHISFNREAQPIKFQRKEVVIPDLEVTYFFKEKDSAMTEILYEWDVFNFDKKQNNKQTPEFQEALIQKYKSLYSKISDEYGISKKTGSLNDLDKINSKGGLRRKDIWEPNDSTEIEMYTVLSNYYEKKGMVTTNPTHRIRLYIKNTKKEKEIIPELTNQRIDSLKIIRNKFLNGIREKNLAMIKDALSEQLINNIPEGQLISLLEFIDPNQNMQLVYSGIQMTLTGKSFAILQFKSFKSAKNEQIIKYVFDEKNKIIGVQPMELLNKGSN